ncbi:MFS transporter (plasmid) [Streptomyces sp. BI20]|uniref:MFS transporter n=1 Tax=Streptomyces sp. BI20 TaxID=3403460 RepID=UPI003C75670A
MKRPTYWLMSTLLLVAMSELQTMGMLPDMARDLGASTAAVGALISLYSLGMALGGPLLAWALRLTPPKTALLGVVAVYSLLEAAVPLVHAYWWVAALRVLTGGLGGAVFGLTLTMAARLAPAPDRVAAPVSVVLGGIMLGAVLGLPVSHAMATTWNWQASFVVLGAAGLLLTLLDARALPDLPAVSAQSSAEDLRQLRSPRLWSRYLVSLLTIGAGYGAFSYFTPLLEQDAGFGRDTTTLILFGYGLCTVLGNAVVGRHADRHAVTLLRVGHLVLAVALVALALCARQPWAALPVVLPAVLLVGLVGVPMNPALVARVVAVGGAGGLVNTVHTSVITLGVAAGSAVGGLAIGVAGGGTGAGGGGTSAAMWIGVVLVALAALVLYSQTRRRRGRGRGGAEGAVGSGTGVGIGVGAGAGVTGCTG